MDLAEFVKTTLTSIKNGVVQANKEAGGGYRMTPSNGKVEFDVAVEVAKEKGSQKGGGLAIKVIEGKISGSSSSKESNITRIKFSVEVSTTIN